MGSSVGASVGSSDGSHVGVGEGTPLGIRVGTAVVGVTVGLLQASESRVTNPLVYMSVDPS